MSNNFGVGPSGFVTKRLDDIFKDLSKEFREIFGDDLDTSANSVTGQEIGTLSKILADCWELAQDVYTARTYRGAENLGLDDLAEYRNIKRNGATKSGVRIAMVADGAGGVTMPGTLTVKAADTGETFKIISSREILKAFSIYSLFEIPTNTAVGNVVSITVSDIDGANSKTVSHAVITGETAAKVAEYLAAGFSTDTRWSVNHSGAKLSLTSYNERYEYSVGALAFVDLKETGTVGYFNATNTGPITGSPYTVTIIETPVSGLRKVFNPWDIQSGRGIERDAELRMRVYKSRTTSVAGVVDAIYNRVTQITGVSFCSVTENDTDNEREGLPPHSLAIVVDGQFGIEDQIAAAIWQSRGGGIQMIGDIGIATPDRLGKLHTVKFSRPSYIPGHIRVKILTFNKDVAPPADWKEKIASAVLSSAVSFPYGVDMPSQGLYGAVYSVSGIGSATVDIGKELTPGAITWTTPAEPVLSILSNERVQFNKTRTAVGV